MPVRDLMSIRLPVWAPFSIQTTEGGRRPGCKRRRILLLFFANLVVGSTALAAGTLEAHILDDDVSFLQLHKEQSWPGMTFVPIPFFGFVPMAMPVFKPKIPKEMLPQAPPETLSESSAKYYWAGKNGDALRTGGSAYESPMKLEDGPSWSWHATGLPWETVIRAAPLIDDEFNIYLATISGHVYKFSKDGEIKWNYVDTSSIPDVPAIYNGVCYVTNDAGVVTAIDMKTGRKRWRVQPWLRSAGDTWSMTAGEGVVISAMVSNLFPGANNDVLVALDAKNGHTKWFFRPDNYIYNSLQAIKNGSLVFSDNTGRVYRVNLQTGALIWKAGPGMKGEIVSPQMTTGGTVIGPNNILYVTSNALTMTVPPQLSGFVTAFSFKNGEVLWRKSTEFMANNAAAVGTLGGKNGRLAVAIGVGENPDIPVPGAQFMNMKDNDPHTRKKKGRVLALDAVTGEEIWRYNMPVWHGWAAGDYLLPPHVCLPDSFGNPSINSNGTVYVGFQDGRFYAINDHNGDGKIDANSGEVSNFNTGNAFQGSPALAPGMVVATPCNGMHVFKTK